MGRMIAARATGGTRLRLSLVLAAPALALAACSPQPAAEATPAAATQMRHPVSNLPLVPVTVTADGEAHVFTSEVATTPEAQAQGLMFRTELADDEAMLFPRSDLGIASFWMKNTPIPLDIIFIGQDRRILNIAAMTTPYSLESVSAIGPTAAVLEIRGGLAEELGIEAGDRVEW